MLSAPRRPGRSSTPGALRGGVVTGLFTLLLALSVAVANGAWAKPPTVPDTGTVQLTLTTPEGMAATAQLTGVLRPSFTAAKPTSGTSMTISLTVPTGLYLLTAQPQQFNGRLYQAAVKGLGLLAVPRGKTVKATVAYSQAASATDLTPTSLQQTSIGLKWSAPAGVARPVYALRRADGDVPPARYNQGTAVPIRGTTATDTQVAPGKQYSYGLFTRVRGAWVGPLSLTVGTLSADGSTQAAYVAAPNTVIATPQDIASTTPVDEDSLQVQLANTAPRPLPGAAVVLPISSALPGGFLGTVEGVAGDGRLVTLTPTGIGDAFDYYSIDIPDIGALDPDHTPLPAPGGGQLGDSLPGLRSVTGALSGVDIGGNLGPCEIEAGVPQVTFSPSIKLGGHFRTTINTGRLLGLSIPTGASFDLEVTTTVGGAMKIHSNAAMSCSIGLPERRFPFSAAPVPLMVTSAMNASFGVDRAIDISNLGATATAGFRASGTFDLDGTAHATGSPISSATPLTPVVSTSSGTSFKVGGDMAVGPGVGSQLTGLIVGAGGELDPLSGEVQTTVTSNGAATSSCTQQTLGLRLDVFLKAKMWVPGASAHAKLNLPGLNGVRDYPGSPWKSPANCSLTPTGPGPGPGPGSGGDTGGDGGTGDGDGTPSYSGTVTSYTYDLPYGGSGPVWGLNLWSSRGGLAPDGTIAYAGSWHTYDADMQHIDGVRQGLIKIDPSTGKIVQLWEGLDPAAAGWGGTISSGTNAGPTTDEDGNIWYPYRGQLARFAPDGSVTFFPIASSYESSASYVFDLYQGPNHTVMVWLSSDTLGSGIFDLHPDGSLKLIPNTGDLNTPRIHPDTGSMWALAGNSTIPCQQAGSLQCLVGVTHDGQRSVYPLPSWQQEVEALSVVGVNGSRVYLTGWARVPSPAVFETRYYTFDTTTHQFEAAESGPYSPFVRTSDGLLWYINPTFDTSQVANFNPVTGKADDGVFEVLNGYYSGEPTVGPNGTLWLKGSSENGASQVVRLTP